MLKISEEFINSTAPNQSAIQNGWGLVKKNKFVSFNISEDDTVIFGECKGSGASNYITSVDFINPESPVSRCSCPSRQFPCKHALGLMYAYVSEKSFDRAEVPADISEKREKAGKREEKKAKAQEEPKKVNVNALIKKIQTQKDGLELLEKIAFSIAQAGLGTINSKTLKLLEDQAKQLGNHYIPGVQTALREFILLFKKAIDYEKVYTEAVDSLIRLYSLCKKGREYLDKKLLDPQQAYHTASNLDEWLGHAWQLSELRELGLVQADAELVQLSFNSYVNDARQEWVDEGSWLNLKTGQMVETRNYRPFKAAKYIREDDSFYSVVQTKELFVYPGDMNPRVRWEDMTSRVLNENDFTLIKSYAHKSFQGIIKEVKNQIKKPLSSKNPIALLQFSAIGIVDGNYILESYDGQRLILSDIPGSSEPPCLPLLFLLEQKNLREQTILVRFNNDMDLKRLYAKPLSIINNESIIRLIY